jgi:hypothetical protein
MVRVRSLDSDCWDTGSEFLRISGLSQRVTGKGPRDSRQHEGRSAAALWASLEVRTFEGILSPQPLPLPTPLVRFQCLPDPELSKRPCGCHCCHLWQCWGYWPWASPSQMFTQRNFAVCFSHGIPLPYLVQQLSAPGQTQTTVSAHCLSLQAQPKSTSLSTMLFPLSTSIT